MSGVIEPVDQDLAEARRPDVLGLVCLIVLLVLIGPAGWLLLGAASYLDREGC